MAKVFLDVCSSALLYQYSKEENIKTCFMFQPQIRGINSIWNLFLHKMWEQRSED